MKWSIPASVRAYASKSGKRHDKALAEELCDLQAIFWAPSSTWSWKSTSGSNRAGWMVQAISLHEEDGDVLLNVYSLHHSDHHKYGDIRVTSSNGRMSIRSIIQLYVLPIPRQRVRHLSQPRGINLPDHRTYHSVVDHYSPHRRS
jgi:hypothetical protein